jgi:hypothetical protein
MLVLQRVTLRAGLHACMQRRTGVACWQELSVGRNAGAGPTECVLLQAPKTGIIPLLATAAADTTCTNQAKHAMLPRTQTLQVPQPHCCTARL